MVKLLSSYALARQGGSIKLLFIIDIHTIITMN